eukprot:TRINITY_DN6572_c0_g1_i2.p1 TRINITY_DN6572_c0_g1~~TRINITY_DN6572_c0_g1_i2.p1  ORF type:complete len:403 (+),score=81.60 TRINITY_DN6572_c0_g1_i2:53-1261(+)
MYEASNRIYSDDEEIYDEEETPEFSSLPTRRCRVEEGDMSLNTTGLLYPNFRLPIDENQFDDTPTLPLEQHRSHDLDGFTKKIAGVVNSSMESSFVIYTAVHRKANDLEYSGEASTGWIAKLKKERKERNLIVTCLHVVGTQKTLPGKIPLFFIHKEKPSRQLDHFEEFSAALAGIPIVAFDFTKMENQGFIQIHPIMETLNIRKKWMEENKDASSAFVDSEFGLQMQPSIDILFLELPLQMANHIALEIKKSPPSKNDPFALMAFHRTQEINQDLLYRLTWDSKARLLTRKTLHPNLSLSVGKVSMPGPLITCLMSTAAQSSGGPCLDENFQVFGINLGSFYDKGTVSIPKARSIHDEDIFRCDLIVDQLTDPTNSQRRNRNVVLSMHHPAVQLMITFLLE